MPDPGLFDPSMLSESDRNNFLGNNLKEAEKTENVSTETRPPLRVPEGKFSSPEYGLDFKSSVSAYLKIPERIRHNNDRIPARLGNFLIEKGFITKIDMWENSWGFKYEAKTISISDNPMPDVAYQYYIFRLGTDEETGQPLYPSKEETNQYRFLHEACHAYQDFLTSEENQDNPGGWYDKAYKREITSNYAKLFDYCFRKRAGNSKNGLSTWGNVPDYNVYSNKTQQVARAIEDANELVTMYLWNPQYFETFLEYLSGNIAGFGEVNLSHDGLLKISHEDREKLKELIQKYVEEMKANIASTY